MPLNLNVAFTEPPGSQLDRQEKSVQVIGEILPLVLARYGIETQHAPRNTETESKIGEVLQRT